MFHLYHDIAVLHIKSQGQTTDNRRLITRNGKTRGEGIEFALCPTKLRT